MTAYLMFLWFGEFLWFDEFELKYGNISEITCYTSKITSEMNSAANFTLRNKFLAQ